MGKNDGYESLANAIVVQAAYDYVSKRTSAAAQKHRATAEAFFKSKYFNRFTTLDGMYILKKLDKMREDGHSNLRHKYHTENTF